MHDIGFRFVRKLDACCSQISFGVLNCNNPVDMCVSKQSQVVTVFVWQVVCLMGGSSLSRWLDEQ